MSDPIQWRIAQPPPDGFRLDLAGTGAPPGPIPSRLLYNRGIRTNWQARQFFDAGPELLSSPFDLPDMDSASARLLTAVNDGESVGVFGDFDVDGLTGTAILVDTIDRLGGSPLPYIPHREDEGHGMSLDSVQSLRQAGASLIVTVDTGTTSHDAVDEARRLGMDTVITDHHLAGDSLPAAAAVVNPGLSDRSSGELTGAGVAFMLARAVFALAGIDQPAHHWTLAALGSIADSAPLRGDNRCIVRSGLEELGKTSHEGLRALLGTSRATRYGKDISAETVAFQLAPRLNAPGRLGDAAPSLELLTTNEWQRAEFLAEWLDKRNTERRKLGEEAFRLARAQVLDRKDRVATATAVLGNVRVGLLGPVAGRLCDEFQRPAIVAACKDGVARASARSTSGFDIHAGLKKSETMFSRFGGHPRAAGFTTAESSLEKVLDSVERQASWALMGVKPTPALDADAEASLEDVGASMWDFIAGMAPFGRGNPAPLLVFRNLKISNVKTVGEGSRHLKLNLESGGARYPAIGFDMGKADLGRSTVDAVCSLTWNAWAGRRTRELHLKDIRPSA